jgi:hypothetical protein
MLLARAEIARQLAHQPGLLRYASGLASPTEFLTLTVWRDHASMQRFMQSGAHERHLWQFTRWTSSFWAMRWEPLGQATDRSTRVSPLVAAGLVTHNPDASRTGSFGARPERGHLEPRASGVTCVTGVFDGAQGVMHARRAVARLRAAQRTEPRLLRWSIGVDLPPRGMAITLWRDEASARQCAAELLHGATWLMDWQAADYEIGQWDGLRLRQIARRRLRDTVGPGQ